MSVVQEVGPVRPVWKSVGLGLFALLCLAVGLYAVVGLASERVDVNAARAASTCGSPGQASPEGVDGCLASVPGHVSGVRRDSRGLGQRYHFVPDDLSADDAFVRFSGDSSVADLSPGLAAIVTGADVTGLAWQGDVVAFDATGERVWTIGYEAGGWTARLWAGVLFLSLGVVGLLGLRRSGGKVSGYLGLGFVGAMLGSLVAFAVPSLTAQVIEVVAMVLAFPALAWWAQSRAARRGTDDAGPVHHASG